MRVPTLIAGAVYAALVATAIANPTRTEAPAMNAHPYVGTWVSKDGHVRQHLLPNGRYDEARGATRSAFTGRYQVRGDLIDYWDDTGFIADGIFVSEDVLHHGGMILYREH